MGYARATNELNAFFVGIAHATECLEKAARGIYFGNHVHCRIGSLEMFDINSDANTLVHCRIGSFKLLVKQAKAV